MYKGIIPRNDTDLDLSRFTSAYQGIVLCPVCRFECNHLSRVEVDQGGDVVEVSPDGPGFLRREPSARGTVIRIDMYCEEGHEYRVSFQFHKGAIFFWASGWQEVPTDSEGCPAHPGELWRD